VASRIDHFDALIESAANPCHFGKFLSKREAEKWIERHRWLTKQSEKLKGKAKQT
jgi:hypothetical protein